MTKPSMAAIEIASYVAHQLTSTKAKSMPLEWAIATAVQKMVEEGRLFGMVATGDHDEDGETVRDWSELAPPTSDDIVEVVADYLQAEVDPYSEHSRVLYQSKAQELLSKIGMAAKKDA